MGRASSDGIEYRLEENIFEFLEFPVTGVSLVSKFFQRVGRYPVKGFNWPLRHTRCDVHNDTLLLCIKMCAVTVILCMRYAQSFWYSVCSMHSEALLMWRRYATFVDEKSTVRVILRM